MNDARKVLSHEIMTEHVVTAKITDPIKDIVHLMLRDRISGMPVIDENEKVCGVITTTDLFRILGDLMIDQTFGDYDHLFKDRKITVGQVMTRDVVTIKSDSPVEEVIKLSVYKGIHLFPVVDGGKLVGILGKRDILNAGFSFVE